ncbi:FAD-binding domain-containing protein [Synechococcus sp. PCC 6312]|uniref:FAD-binding domain-containing protein n=1 Tax=Synechococcus sp. (strain ATCC 27167 / PCC 6312) TaxID=195253 RepID=UPI00029F4080|nr:FAD-binding domain-containing protein [Synechococcus sp. PCC 6312]AFY59472.1 deoxyribodipyrimidine photolyase [Synechococcus sp. PCC 6312]
MTNAPAMITPKTQPLILLWHRRDLRIQDHLGLAAAREKTAKVVGLFCFDPKILGGEDIAAVRVAYLVGCLEDLAQQYHQAGSQLLILQGEPTTVIPKLAQALKAQALYWHCDVEPYAQARDKAVAQALAKAGISVQTFWDQLLVAPEAIRTGSGAIYTVYSPFWKNWQQHPKAQPVPTLHQAQGLTSQELDIAQQNGMILLPTTQDLGFTWDQELVLAPGVPPAQARLEDFCQRAINSYEPDRNFPGIAGTSGLSAALKFGVLGIREIWAASREAQAQARSEESLTAIRTWQQELAWREFYQHVMYAFPELAQGPYRQPFQNFPWSNNQDHFQAWCEGKTGFPIVDAAMRQLNQTGWMHNRCRMIVASFLTKDLIINPQWGENYFMQRLIDGDLSANNGGWQWSASSGMDPKPLRIFNPHTQAQKFDAEADYIRYWLPELRGVETADLLTGRISPLERQACNYPMEIVDHKVQQQKFKQLYARQKA